MEEYGSRIIIRAIEGLLREAVETRDWERVESLVELRRLVQAQEPEWRSRDAAADMYSLVHADFGPIATFTARHEAEDELAAVLRDEPGWADVLTIEPFQVAIVER